MKQSLITKGSRKAGHNEEGNLKGTGARHLYVPKDELLGKKTFLAEQGAFAGTQVKKEFMTSGRRGRQEYKDVFRSWSEKIRKAKTQLELNLL